MYNVHGERSGGYSGIAFVICLALSAIVPGIPPDPAAPAGEIVSAFQSHRVEWLLAMWLQFPGLAFFLWFAVGMRAYLRQAPGQDEGLPTYGLAAAIATAAVAMVAQGGLSAIAYSSGADVPPGALKAVYAFATIMNAAVFFPLTAFILALAHSMRRHASAPRWLAYLGYVAAAAVALTTLTVFAPGGLWSPIGAGAAPGLLLFVIWLVCASVALIRNAALASTRTPA